MPPKTANMPIVADFAARIRSALLLLLEGFQYSEQTSYERWEFAVEIDELAALGLSRNDFRWLVRKELVEHQREVTLAGDDGRDFRPSGDLTFSTSTCFILTDAGVSIALEVSRAPQSASSPVALSCDSSADEADEGEADCALASARNLPTSGNGRNGRPQIPAWDAEKRELRINGTIIKQFKWTAANQETILAAFEEDGWPHRIDDPLPPQLDQDSKRRLSDTIKCLNRKQKSELIRFHGDGTGEGVTWEAVECDSTCDSSSG